MQPRRLIVAPRRAVDELSGRAVATRELHQPHGVEGFHEPTTSVGLGMHFGHQRAWRVDHLQPRSPASVRTAEDTPWAENTTVTIRIPSVTEGARGGERRAQSVCGTPWRRGSAGHLIALHRGFGAGQAPARRYCPAPGLEMIPGEQRACALLAPYLRCRSRLWATRDLHPGWFSCGQIGARGKSASWTRCEMHLSGYGDIFLDGVGNSTASGVRG